MDNRRQHARVAYRQTVLVKLYSVANHPDMKNRELKASTSDVSEGGLRITCEKDLTVGTKVKLRISIENPPSHFIHECEVRWRQTDPTDPKLWQIGLQFAETSETHRMEWIRLIRQLTRSPASSTSPGAVPVDD